MQQLLELLFTWRPRVYPKSPITMNRPYLDCKVLVCQQGLGFQCLVTSTFQQRKLAKKGKITSYARSLEEVGGNEQARKSCTRQGKERTECLRFLGGCRTFGVDLCTEVDTRSSAPAKHAKTPSRGCRTFGANLRRSARDVRVTEPSPQNGCCA